jgi:hypothetical protein
MVRTTVEDVAVGHLLPKCGSSLLLALRSVQITLCTPSLTCDSSTVGGAAFYCRDRYKANVVGFGCL